MRYPIAISDYDDTLVRTDKTIGAYTRAVLRAYVAQGGVFAIATGRMTEGIRSQLGEIGLGDFDLPLLTYQGAYCETARTHRVLFDAPLEAEIAQEVLAFCKERGVYAQTYWDGTVHTERAIRATLTYCRSNAVPYTLEPDLARAARGRTVYKVMTWVDDPAEAAEHAAAMEARFGAECRICRSDANMTDAFSLRAGKEVGCAALAEALGRSMKDCVVFGDNFNDIGMVRAAGLGVAIGNAVPALKAVAARVAPDNDSDGVARVLAELEGLRVGA